MAANETIADYLESRKNEILMRWVDSVVQDEQIPQTSRQSREKLIDHFPVFLQRVIEMLRAGGQKDRPIEAGVVAAERAEPIKHAKLRFDTGYSVEGILREVMHLRYTLMQALQPAGMGQDLESSLLIHSSIDHLGMESAKELAEWQNQLLQSVVMQDTVGMVVISDTGDFQLFNAAAETMLGSPNQERLDEWLLTHGFSDASGEALPREKMPYYRAMQGESVRETYRVRSHDNSMRWFEVTAQPLFSIGGEKLGAVIFFHDVTELRSAAEYMREMAEFQQKFIGVLAHDLKNPLTAIRAYAELAVSREEISLPQFRNAAIAAFTKIDIAARRIQRMIDDVLDFTQSRLGGGIPVKFEPVDLVALCNAVVDELRVLFPERILNIEVLGKPAGNWDPGRLMQVFSNLITNAIKYSPHDSIITIVVKDEGDTVHFSVLNVGEIIPKEQLDRIFEPYIRLNKDVRGRPKEGLGLGLFIVRSIVEAHRGSVNVESIDNIGTTFTVKLPKQPETGKAPAE